MITKACEKLQVLHNLVRFRTGVGAVANGCDDFIKTTAGRPLIRYHREWIPRHNTGLTCADVVCPSREWMYGLHCSTCMYCSMARHTLDMNEGSVDSAKCRNEQGFRERTAAPYPSSPIKGPRRNLRPTGSLTARWTEHGLFPCAGYVVHCFSHATVTNQTQTLPRQSPLSARYGIQ